MAPPTSRKDYQQAPIVDDEDDLIDADDADLNSFDDPLQQASSSSRAPVSGNIGSAPSGSGSGAGGWTSRMGIYSEDRAAPLNTIDESVWDTVSRDLRSIWGKTREVLWPRYLLGGSMFDRDNGGGGDGPAVSGWRGVYAALRGAGLQGARDELAGLAGRVMDAEALLSRDQNAVPDRIRDWDLWGPLISCLLLATLLSMRSRHKQQEVVFSGVFAMVWIGEALVTLQIRLLGGNISFAQSICVIGYTLFPLVLAALMSALKLYWVARIPIYLVLVLWSLAAGVSILGGSGVVKNRVGLAVYPMFVFYLGLGCLCFIS